MRKHVSVVNLILYVVVRAFGGAITKCFIFKTPLSDSKHDMYPNTLVYAYKYHLSLLYFSFHFIL